MISEEYRLITLTLKKIQEMAISEFETFKIEKLASQFCAARNKHFPPEQLKICYRVEDQDLYIFEVRPHWKNPEISTELMTAKIKYIKSKSIWRLYWQRQNMKWVSYEPMESSSDLSLLLEEIEKDPFGCFWG